MPSIETLIIRFCFATWTFFAKIFVSLFFQSAMAYMKKRAVDLQMNWNGPKPTDIQIKSDEYWYRVAVHWSLGFGEAYVDGIWTAEDLPGAIGATLRTGGVRATIHPLTWMYGYFNLQKEGEDAMAVAEQHYNFGNDWYEAFLGPTMQYTCANFKTATDLDTAQFDKMELVAQKLKLKPGMRVLDFGCGWGGLALHLAKHHSVSVVGITNSVEQGKYLREKVKGYPIEILVIDYRKVTDLDGCFDRVTAIGSSEHVGVKNYKTFFGFVRRWLKDEGIALVQAIIRNDDQVKYGNEPFVHKYIFPNGWSASHFEFAKGVQGILRIEDWASYGKYYSKTVECWRTKFHKAWPELSKKYGCDEKLFRIWDYYFALAIALFTENQFTLCHIVLSKGDLKDNYVGIR